MAEREPFSAANTTDVRAMSAADLMRPVLKAVMISMATTGEYKTRDGSDFYSHDDYDEAHACLGELVLLAKWAIDSGAPRGR